MIRRIAFLLIVLFSCSFLSIAQLPVKEFQKTDSQFCTSTLLSNKNILAEIAPPICISLSYYPELMNTHIVFRFRKRTTPLSSRPRISSLFKKKKNRTYVITISSQSTQKLNPIIFSNLPFNAQIGVIGHELAHIKFYNAKNSFQLIALPFKLTSKKFTDQFEFNTDLSCINQGLGYQLYDWSLYVRKALQIPEWKGAVNLKTDSAKTLLGQRYMNPETIEKYMKENSMYTNMRSLIE